MKIAAVTMCRNEHLFLPMWLAHYGRHLGANNLFVVDNDTSDGSTVDLGPASRIRYPRTAFDDRQRANFLSDFANSLRALYDVVIVTDCDEFLVPDPGQYSSLQEFIERTPGDVLAATGLNVHHILTEEDPFVPSRPVFGQRSFVQFVSPMCKPSITRVPVRYSPGFHMCSLSPRFAVSLFNFHLRWVDCCYSLQRLSLTRNMVWSDSTNWHYQRQSDEDTLGQFLRTKKTSRRVDDEFTFEAQLAVMQEKIGASGSGAAIPQDLRDDYLTRVPERFRGVL